MPIPHTGTHIWDSEMVLCSLKISIFGIPQCNHKITQTLRTVHSNMHNNLDAVYSAHLLVTVPFPLAVMVRLVLSHRELVVFQTQ